MNFKKIVLFFLIICTVTFSSEVIAKNGSVKKLLIIDSQAGDPYEPVRLALIRELALEGYQVGNNLQIVYYSLGNFEGKAINIWNQESTNKYDAIFLNGTIAGQAFKKLSKNNSNKFIFASVTDPVGLGLIESFNAPPKYNFSGISFPVNVKRRLRFIKTLIPTVKKIGLIYSDMPQSISYRKWIDEALLDPEFKDLAMVYRTVNFIKSEGGHQRMTLLAQKYVEELNPLVDVFLSPNDQMGVKEAFARMVYSVATKPLIGLSRNDVVEGWGATASIYPDFDEVGKRIAQMIKMVFEGKSIKQIYPEWPAHVGVAIDLKKSKKFKITISDELMKEANKNLVH